MKNKKLILFLIALNTLYGVKKSEIVETDLKDDGLYNKIIKNIDNKELTTKNYKLIEKILNKRNRELRDLYMQNNYIIKPEFLEWQIFYSGFFNENSRVGSISENKKKENGYGNWNDKNIQMKTEGEFSNKVKVGPSIPYKFLDLKEVNVDIEIPDISEINEVNLDRSPLNINITQVPVLPDIEIKEISTSTINNIDVNKNISVTPMSIVAAAKMFYVISPPILQIGGNINGYTSAAQSYNLNTNTQTPALNILNAADNQSTVEQIVGVEGTNYANLGTGDTAGNVTYRIGTDLTTNKTGSRIIAIESHRGGPVLTDASVKESATGRANDVLYVSTTGTLTTTVNNSKILEIEVGDNGLGDPNKVTFRNDSVYVNNGVFISNANTSNVVMMDFIGETANLHIENHGIININGSNSIGVQNRYSGFKGIRNTGIINLNGNNNYGMVISAGIFDGTSRPTAENLVSEGTDYVNAFMQEGTINLNGNNSYGIIINGGSFGENGILNSENGNIIVNGSGSTGLSLNSAGNYSNKGSLILNGNNGTGIRVEKGTFINTGVNANIKINNSANNSAGMASLGGIKSKIINEATILINASGNDNVGMYALNSGLVEEGVVNKGTINIKPTGSSTNNHGITFLYSAGTNSGNIILEDTGTTGKNLGIYSQGGEVYLSGNSSITLNTKGNNIGIYLKDTSSLYGDSGSITVNNTGTVHDYGVYLDTVTSNMAYLSGLSFNLSGKAIGAYSGRGVLMLESGSSIDLNGADAIGLLYETTANSPSRELMTNEAVINSDKGIGMYLYDKVNKTVSNIKNSGTIKATSGGVGIGIGSDTYNSASKTVLTNSGTINISNSVSNTGIGVYVKNHNVQISGAGSITLDSQSNENVGVYLNQGSIDFQSSIKLGNNGIGIYLNGDAANLNNSSLTIGAAGTEVTQETGTAGTGVAAKGEKADVTIGTNGLTLTGVNNLNKGSLGVFLENSNLSNNGIIKTGDYGTAVYLKSVNSARNIQFGNLETGDKGIGIYLDNQSIVTTGDTLSSLKTGRNSVAVYGNNSDIDVDIFDSGKITLGSGSTGYFLEGGKLKSGNGAKNIVLGDDITGVVLTKNTGIDSTINSIKIGDKLTPASQTMVLGIKGISSPFTLTTSLKGGDGAVGLYYKEDGTGNVLTYNGKGSTSIPDIEVGKRTGMYTAIGLYMESNTNSKFLELNNTYIRVNGLGAVGLGIDTGQVKITNGIIEIADGGVGILKKNGGNTTSDSTIQYITPDTNIEMVRAINSDHTNTRGTIMNVPDQSIAIHGESGIMTNEGEIVSKILNGKPSVNAIGIYMENTKSSVSGVLDLPVSSSKGINKNIINLGKQGIGMLGEYSALINSETGKISTEDNGAGMYLTTGGTAENNGTITAGSFSSGIYAKDGNIIKTYTGLDKSNNILNNTTGLITSAGNEASGIYSLGTGNARSEIRNYGNIDLSGNHSAGIYGERTNITNTGNISVGNGTLSGTTVKYSSGIIAKDSNILFQSGTVTGGNNSTGIAAIGVNESVSLKITGGLVLLGQNSVYEYIKRGNNTGLTAELEDTSGGVLDLNKNKQIGIYTEEGNITSNKKISVRENTGSIGVYAKNNGLTDMQVKGLTLEIENNQLGIFAKSDFNSQSKVLLHNTLNVAGTNAIGILKKEGNVENTGSISVSGNGGIGIFSEDKDGTQNGRLLNTGSITVEKESGIGIYGRTTGNGTQSITNTGLITLKDSANKMILGLYGEGNTTLENSGDMSIGKNAIGIYGKEAKIKQTGGMSNISKNAIGTYADGGTAEISDNVTMNVEDGNSAAVYGTNGSKITLGTARINVGDTSGTLSAGSRAGSFGIIGKSLSDIKSYADINVSLGSVGIYSENSKVSNYGKIKGLGTATVNGDARILIYGQKGSNISNEAGGELRAENAGVGIYSQGGTISNTGIISVGDTYADPSNSDKRQFAVGIYGENTTSIKNAGSISAGNGAIGIYSYISSGNIENTGTIKSTGNNSTGIYAEMGNSVTGIRQTVENKGLIELSGSNSIGIAGINNVNIINDTAGKIIMSGSDSVGIYAENNVNVINKGLIKATGENGIGIQLKKGSTLLNTGIIEIDMAKGGRAIVVDEGESPVNYVSSVEDIQKPSIVNAGIIKVSEKFVMPKDAVIQILVDPSTMRTINPLPGDYDSEDINGKFLISNSVHITAPEFELRNVQITTDFTQGTNISTYKLEDVFIPTTPGGGINYGTADIKSRGILWNAVPVVNEKGNLDIWMERKKFGYFGKSLSWENFAELLDKNYDNAAGESLKFYDRLDVIESEEILRKTMNSLSGSIYANRIQRDNDIKKVFDDALEVMQDSSNKTKENVKMTVLGGKGKTYEDTEGISDYSYETIGIYALREVERTYSHKFGYSAGYSRNDFKFQDGSQSEEDVDTIQIGLHNTYEKNTWKYLGNLSGRVNFHNMEREISWPNSLEKINGDYVSYGISLDNELSKAYQLGKSFTISPLVNLNLGFQYQEQISEDDSLGALEIDSNNAYSIKPGVGFRVSGSRAIGKNKGWIFKTVLDLKYEYELGDAYPQEEGRMMVFNEKYKLREMAEDRGEINTRILAGMESEYGNGVFLTGEYGVRFGEDVSNGENYKVGVMLKASF
jgi:hypothetical protein